jgi:hypothetical protein
VSSVQARCLAYENAVGEGYYSVNGKGFRGGEVGGRADRRRRAGRRGCRGIVSCGRSVMQKVKGIKKQAL